MTWRGLAYLLAAMAIVGVVVAVLAPRHGPQNALADAVETTEHAGPIEYAATVTFSGGAGGTNTVTIDGARDMSDGRGWESTSSGGSQAESISDGGHTLYTRLTSREVAWEQTDSSALAKALKVPKDRPNSFRGMIDGLRKLQDVRVVGNEVVDGVRMRRYHGRFPPHTTQFGNRVSGDVDVWVDESGRIRRRVLESDQGDGVHMSDTLEFRRFGVPVQTAPPPGEPIVQAPVFGG